MHFDSLKAHWENNKYSFHFNILLWPRLVPFSNPYSWKICIKQFMHVWRREVISCRWRTSSVLEEDETGILTLKINGKCYNKFQVTLNVLLVPSPQRKLRDSAVDRFRRLVAGDIRELCLSAKLECSKLILILLVNVSSRKLLGGLL